MRPNLLSQLIEELISSHQLDAPSELVMLLQERPMLFERLREAAQPNHWAHLEESARDGWYCVPASHVEEGYAVYYQERGRVLDDPEKFEDRAVAVCRMLSLAGYLPSKHLE